MAADPLKLDSAVTPTTHHPGAEQEDTFEWNWNMEPLLNIYKFALLWGEAQLCLPYICLLIE